MLLVHGEHDLVITARDRAPNAELVLFAGCPHMLEDPELYIQTVISLFRKQVTIPDP